jgi:FkbM family methyltransferase
MNGLEGPRMYYSLFGLPGLVLGAKARVLKRPIELKVGVPGIAHPVHLRLRTTDVALCQEILLHGQYDWAFAETPKVIVDAGANIGMAAIFYATKFPESKIVAIEPEPSNYEMLKKNVALYPNIVTIHAALWRDDEELDIFNPGSGNTTFRTRRADKAAVAVGRHPVRGCKLDTLMKDLGIGYVDLLKVDIEGSEKEVFEHSRGWIGEVGVLAVEIHDWIQSGCGDSVRMAAKDFEFTGQKGETTYFVRKGQATQNLVPEAPTSSSRVLNSPRFPLKILQVV